MSRKPIPEALELIREGEALRLFAYPDPAQQLYKMTPIHLRKLWGFKPAREILAMPEMRAIKHLPAEPWTCGYGHTKGVTQDTTCTPQEAERWLLEDTQWAGNAVSRNTHVRINDFMFGALLSLVINIGEGAFAKSTLLKKLNAHDYDGALARFDDFVKVRNKQTKKLEHNQGLYNRRQKEKAFWLKGDVIRTDDEITPSPLSIVEETQPVSRPATQDPNLMTNYATGAGTIGATLSEVAGRFEPIALYSDTIKYIFVALTVASIVFGIWYRTRQRKQEV